MDWYYAIVRYRNGGELGTSPVGRSETLPDGKGNRCFYWLKNKTIY